MTRKDSTSATQDAIDLLNSDHRAVLRMFEQFRSRTEASAGASDGEGLQELAERICAELQVHTQLEEEYFYPAAREAIDDDLLMDEAIVEHQGAEQLIAELQSMQPDDELYAARVNVLGEYVRHHIDEEQEKMFPATRKAGLDLGSLAEDMRTRRAELREEFGLADEGHPEMPPQPGQRPGGHARA